MTDWIHPDEFEKRVAHVARNLWPGAGIGGSYMESGRERDGIYITEECVHAIEATLLQKLEKAKKDSDKLQEFGVQARKDHPDKAVKLWFVTKEMPTAEQRTECLKKGVQPVSFDEFQQRLIDIRRLLASRANYRFGSNDEVGPTGAGEVKYIDFGVSNIDRTESFKATDLANRLAEGGRYTLLGDFGAGKSTALLQIYRRLEDGWKKGLSHRFPVYINLRDHQGAEDAVEILERHAKRIGFQPVDHLVRAWRAGYCHLLLDGFDEVSPIGVAAKTSILKNARLRALAAVRELIRDQPTECGVVISGRPHYFDAIEERRAALGTRGFVDLLLNDFTESQVLEYFRACGISGVVPRWLPKRPYLVAMLARRGVTLNEGVDLDPGAGWSYLLEQICDREALIAPAVEGAAVRQILERLATRARKTTEGLGPLSGSEFVQTFNDVCGFEPDDNGHQLLARLSGLAVVRPGEESRQFIDEEFADACRAGDVARFCTAPWGPVAERLKDAVRALGQTGVAVLDATLPEGHPEGLFRQALENSESATSLDVFNLLQQRGIGVSFAIRAKDVAVGVLHVRAKQKDAAEVVLVDGFVDFLDMDSDAFQSPALKLESTYVREIVGPAGPSDVPVGFLDADCHIESWASSADRNAAVLAELPDLRIAVLVVVLRKVFMQSGNGRQEDALYRGLSTDAQRYVGPVLDVLNKAGLVAPYKKRGKTLWVPDRSEQGRAEAMIKRPMAVTDSILSAVRSI